MNKAFVVAASVGLSALFISLSAVGISNASRVPVLLYHSSFVRTPCDYGNNAELALQQDLQAIRNEGFTVVPVYWLAEWAIGSRDGSTLPPWVVGLTFDDGYAPDWYDNTPYNHPCAPLTSFRATMQAFKTQYSSELPSWSPHAAAFVIASPVIRLRLDDDVPPGFGTTGINDFMTDSWWSSAQSSGLMEIYNHSTDHGAAGSQVYDAALGIYVPVVGGNVFTNIDTYASADAEIVKAATYIQSKIGVWPDLFAYPFGHVTSYLRDTYFPTKQSEHNTLAAFAVLVGTAAESYVSRSSNRWSLPRLGHSGEWTTPSGFLDILRNSLKPDERAIGKYYLGLLARIGDSAGYDYYLQNVRSTRCNSPSNLYSLLDTYSYNFTISSEFTSRGLSNSDYVTALYRGLLQREPDSGGLAYHTNGLNSSSFTREQVRASFVASSEFQDTVLNPILAASCVS